MVVVSDGHTISGSTKAKMNTERQLPMSTTQQPSFSVIILLGVTEYHSVSWMLNALDTLWGLLKPSIPRRNVLGWEGLLKPSIQKRNGLGWEGLLKPFIPRRNVLGWELAKETNEENCLKVLPARNNWRHASPHSTTSSAFRFPVLSPPPPNTHTHFNYTNPTVYVNFPL